MSLDLTNIAVIDNHCHPILKDQSISSPSAWRQLFSEAADASTKERHVPFTVFYRRLIRSMARFHDCQPTEEAVLAARESCDRSAMLRRLGAEANIHTLVIDTGYPPQAHTTPNDVFVTSFGC